MPERKIKSGMRIQLHPASDWWMRGARYGEVLALLPGGKARVKLDNWHGEQLFFLEDLEPVEQEASTWP